MGVTVSGSRVVLFHIIGADSRGAPGKMSWYAQHNQNRSKSMILPRYYFALASHIIWNKYQIITIPSIEKAAMIVKWL